MEIKERLNQAILAAAQQAMADGAFCAGKLPKVILEVPPQKEFGDFATNFALQSAKAAKMKPRLIAEAIASRLNAPWIEKVEIAGPGFINFYLKSDVMFDTLSSMIERGAAYGTLPRKDAGRIQVEYVSANPTGPLHVGHGRGAAFGSALVNLLRAAGYDVESEYYINDAGNQIDNLAASVNARYLELLGEAAEFPENGYHGQDIVETAERIIRGHGDKFLRMDAADRLEIFKGLALEEKLAALRDDLADFNVRFDTWFSERTLHEADEIKKTSDVLLTSGSMYEKDGALWLKSTAYGDDKDRVVVRDNGVPTYLAADIAYHRNKLARGYRTLINIWGADHHGYICRVKAAIAALGYDAGALEVLILQMVSLYQGGQLVKMSKRTGKSVTLNELVEEVGADAARFFFVMRSIDSQLDFDLDLAKSRSNENPVFYVQYAHARICSIFRQAEEAGRKTPESARLDLLKTPWEIDLIKKLAQYEEEIEFAAKERAPHRIARYVHELAGLFHSFYNQCRIMGESEALGGARLALVGVVRNTIRHALGVLGVSAPEKM